MFLPTIFVLILAISSAQSQDACDGTCSACFGGNVPVKQLNYSPGNHLNIFYGQRFTCTGTVVAWKLFARRAGQVFIDVWREAGSEDGVPQLEMVASSLIVVGEEGFKEICLGSPVPVQEGDIIGVHYPPRDENDNESSGVIYYERTDKEPKTFDHVTEVNMAETGKFWNVDNIELEDDTYVVGKKIPMGAEYTTRQKVVALSPVVMAADDVVVPADDVERTVQVSIPVCGDA